MRDPFEWPGRDDFEGDDTVAASAKRTLDEYADATGIEWITPESLYAAELSDDDDSEPTI